MLQCLYGALLCGYGLSVALVSCDELLETCVDVGLIECEVVVQSVADVFDIVLIELEDGWWCRDGLGWWWE